MLSTKFCSFVEFQTLLLQGFCNYLLKLHRLKEYFSVWALCWMLYDVPNNIVAATYFIEDVWFKNMNICTHEILRTLFYAMETTYVRSHTRRKGWRIFMPFVLQHWLQPHINLYSWGKCIMHGSSVSHNCQRNSIRVYNKWSCYKHPTWILSVCSI